MSTSPSKDYFPQGLTDEDDPTGVDVVGIAQNYRWWLAAGAVGGLMLGILAYLRLGPMYAAGSKILVSQPTTVAIREVEQVARESRGEHVALIMSEEIVGRAVATHNLDKLPSLRVLDDPVGNIVGKLEVKRSAGRDRSFLNVLDIKYLNRREEDSRIVAQAVIDAYGSYLKETSDEQGNAAFEQSKRAKEELERQIAETEEEYAEFRATAPLHWRTPPGVDRLPDDVLDVYQDRVEKTEQDRQRVMLLRAELRSRLDAVNNAIASGGSPEQIELLVRQLMTLQGGGTAQVTDALNNPSNRPSYELDGHLLPLLVREEQLRMKYGDGYRELQAVRRSIDRTIGFYRERGIELPKEAAAYDAADNRISKTDITSIYRKALEHQLLAIDAQIVRLDEMYEDAQEQAKKFAHFHARDRALNDELIRLRSLREDVVNTLSAVDLVKGNDTYRMRQISPVRSELSKKRIIKFFGVGTMFGIFSVFVLAYLKETFDTAVRSVEDVRQRTRFPVLGSVPEYERAGSELPANSPFRPLGEDVIYLHHPGSAAAEAYRSIRTAVLSARATSGQSIFQVSSPEPGDGKSTVLANLAVATAHAGKRVLVIDSDLRKPRMHDFFKVRDDIGLTDVLAAELEPVNAIQPTVVANLSVMAAGGQPENPSEILSAQAFDVVLEPLRNQFDVILIDTPPLLAVTDPCIIANHTDAMIFVSRVGKNRIAAISRSQELIDMHNISTVGSVINGVEASEAYGRYRETDRYESKRPALEPEPEPVLN